MPARLAPSGVMPLANGGTGATTPAAARTALGLGGAAVLNVGTVGGMVMDGADTRVTGAQQASGKGIANGYAGLDGNALVPLTQLPPDPSRAAASNPTISGSVTVAAANTAGAQARWISSNPGAGTDAKLADYFLDGASWVFRLLNDASTSASNWLTVVRSGYVASSITLAATNINLQGILGLSAPLPLGSGGTGAATAAAALANLGAYPTTGGNVSGPVNASGQVTGQTLAMTGNLGSGYAPGSEYGLIGWNFTGGGAEIDFFNSVDAGFSGSFAWYQRISGAWVQQAAISKVGNLSVRGGLTLGTALPLGSGGTGATSAAAALAALGGMSANNTSFTGNSFTFGTANNATTTAIEFGSTVTAGTTYLDWHSSGSNNDFDVRLAATGGAAGTTGGGTFDIRAASFTFNGGAVLTAAQAVSVAQGGTGATTPSAARTALGAAASTTPAIAGAPVITVGSDLVGRRSVTGNFGVVDFFDGANWYFLVTTSGNQLTTTYSGIRPLHINLTTGLVNMDSGAAVAGGLSADTLAVTAPPTFPTAGFGTNTTAGATTGFVQAAVAALDGGTF